jgi:hypothetical protein
VQLHLGIRQLLADASQYPALLDCQLDTFHASSFGYLHQGLTNGKQRVD